MNDFERYCKNRIKYGFFRFFFFFLIATIIFFLSSKFDLFASKVYALENKTIYGSTSGDWYNQTLSQSGKFIYNANTNGGQTAGNVGTTYSDANFGMYFGFYHTITAGKIYNVKINFNDYDVRHTIDYSYIHINGGACTVQAFQLESTNNSGNAKTISVSFSCPNPSNAVWFSIYKESDGYYYVTTVNWRFNSLQIEESTDGTDNIINNNNMNTQNIINNNNTNTQEIIDNQNQNTEDLINSQKVCNMYDKSSIVTEGLLDHNGTIDTSFTDYGVTDYINILGDTTITMLRVGGTAASLCFYNNDKSISRCDYNYIYSDNSIITPPINAVYVRFAIRKSTNQPTFKICKDGNQATTDAINDLNDTIKDTNVDTSSLNNLAGYLPPGPVDSILNLPLTLFNSLLTAMNLTCQPINLPLPYVNKNLTIPCLSSLLQEITGFWGWYEGIGVLVAGIILYYYLLNLYKWVDDTLTLRENTMPGYFDDNWGGGA